jgi:hypothetical protein
MVPETQSATDEFAGADDSDDLHSDSDADYEWPPPKRHCH